MELISISTWPPAVTAAPVFSVQTNAGMRRPSWNKSQAVQQVISLKALLEPCHDADDDAPSAGAVPSISSFFSKRPSDALLPAAAAQVRRGILFQTSVAFSSSSSWQHFVKLFLLDLVGETRVVYCVLFTSQFPVSSPMRGEPAGGAPQIVSERPHGRDPPANVFTCSDALGRFPATGNGALPPNSATLPPRCVPSQHNAPSIQLFYFPGLSLRC